MSRHSYVQRKYRQTVVPAGIAFVVAAATLVFLGAKALLGQPLSDEQRELAQFCGVVLLFIPAFLLFVRLIRRIIQSAVRE